VFLILGIVCLLILALACANAANMQLARAMSRRREIAVRVSLGAGAGRVLRQLLTESLLVSGLAAAVSLAIAAWLPAVVIRYVLPSEGILSIRFQIDWRVIAAMVVLTAAAALLSGLAPAITLVREGVAHGLRESGRTTSAGRLRRVLLAAQVALCATLLSGAGLMIRAMQEARKIDPGFAHAQIIRLSPYIESSGASQAEAQVLIEQLTGRIAGMPGVAGIAHTNVVPLGDSFERTSYPNPTTGEQVRVGVTSASASFLRTLRIPLLTGRYFEPADESRKDGMIIDEDLARRMWPEGNAVGKVLSGRTVIGVVKNVRVRGLIGGDPQIYFPSKGHTTSEFLIAHEGPPGNLLTEIPKLARSMDRRIFPTAAPYTATVDKARASAAVAASVSSALSGLALALACLGIYGVAAYGVSQRVREIGIRMAIGAKPLEIITMVIGQNARIVAIGAVLGLVGAIGFGQVLTSLLYGVEPSDPRALVAAMATLAATALLAAWFPARRASRVDPAIALRSE
jgi:predicted permease